MLIKIAKYFSVSCDFLLDIESKETIDCSGLTQIQIAHIKLIIKDIIENK